MNTLYYFSLNPDVGTLSRREINDYEIVKHSWNPSRDSISFSGKYGAIPILNLDFANIVSEM